VKDKIKATTEKKVVIVKGFLGNLIFKIQEDKE
jgi:hypothetical protein